MHTLLAGRTLINDKPVITKNKCRYNTLNTERKDYKKDYSLGSRRSLICDSREEIFDSRI